MLTLDDWADAEIDHAIACAKKCREWADDFASGSLERASLETAAQSFDATAHEIDILLRKPFES